MMGAFDCRRYSGTIAMLPLNGFGQAGIIRTQLKLERVAPQRELALSSSRRACCPAPSFSCS
jgi:hypothetical protein